MSRPFPVLTGDVVGLTGSSYNLETGSQRRGPTDNRFSWGAAVPLELELAITGGIANYTEVLVVSEYEIGITPDLGWDNVEAMFNAYSPSNPTDTNAKLFLKKGLHVDLGTLTYDQEDREVYVELSDDEMDSFLSDGYPTYLWAIRGYTNRSERTQWSDIRKFAGQYEAPTSLFSVAEVPAVSPTRTVALAGNKDPSIRAIEINGFTGGVVYPSQETWRLDVPLEPGENIFNIRGYPIYGRATPIVQVEVDLFTGEVKRQSIPNTFDHFGALHGVDRLYSLDESNENYKTRIIDVFTHKADSNLQGLHHSVARQLDLTYDDYALTIRPTALESWRRADDAYPALELQIRTNNIYLASPGFKVHNEYHIIEPQNLSILLANEMTPNVTDEEDVFVYSPPGNEVPKADYVVNYETKTLVFNKEKYQGKDCWVSYAKKLSIDIGPSITLSTVVTNLEAIQYDSRQLLTVTLSSDRVGTESSDGLLRQDIPLSSIDRYEHPTNGTTMGRRIRWTNLSLQGLLDQDYWSRHVNEDGHVLNTIIEAHVDSFNRMAHHTYEQIVLDRDTWDPVDEDVEVGGHLWRLWDAIGGYWRSSNLSNTTRYSTAQAFDRGFIVEEDKSIMRYVGVPKEDFKSGIGKTDDLKVVITKPSSVEQLSDPGVFRATVSWAITGQVSDATFLPSSVYGGLLFQP